MGLCGTGQRFESSISGAASTMREVQSLSEELHATYITLPAIWGALQAFFLAGLIMIAIGTILITRVQEKRKKKKRKT
jgi:uncharacterized integral membrane protein